MFETPAFVPAMTVEISGDDPLGLAPVNERLYGSVFPGINNVVRYIRVYSALCWQIQRIQLFLDEHAGNNSLTTEQAKSHYKNALEKIQLLLTWANKANQLPGLVGGNRAYPSDDEEIDLVFAAFGDNNAGYITAVQYRPSITTGLNFLESRGEGMLGNLPAGEKLAQAFDEQARAHPKYDWLADITALAVTPGKVAALHSILDLQNPSINEQQAFLTQYFPLQRPDDVESTPAHRWASLMLVLETIKTLNEEKVDTNANMIRMAMASGFGPNGSKLNIDGLELEQQWWAVLQVRQLQRLALDTLEAILERRLDLLVNNNMARDIMAVCGDFQQQLNRHLGDAATVLMQQRKGELKQVQDKCATLYEAALSVPTADIFAMVDTLWNVGEPDEQGTFAQLVPIFDALLACAVEAENLLENQLAREAVEADKGDGSLAELAQSANQFAAQTPGQWLAHLMQHWVINRHFEVVARRSQNSGDGKNRFRFIAGDYGLQRFDSARAPSYTSFASDRLERALDLLEQAGLIKLTSHGYVLIKVGKQRLQTERHRKEQKTVLIL
jgi:hypothetical protein